MQSRIGILQLKVKGKQARPPQIFDADYALNKPRAILRSLEPPPSLPRRAREFGEPIDWRICGDQDPQPEE